MPRIASLSGNSSRPTHIAPIVAMRKIRCLSLLRTGPTPHHFWLRLCRARNVQASTFALVGGSSRVEQFQAAPLEPKQRRLTARRRHKLYPHWKSIRGPVKRYRHGRVTRGVEQLGKGNVAAHHAEKCFNIGCHRADLVQCVRRRAHGGRQQDIVASALGFKTRCNAEFGYAVVD